MSNYQTIISKIESTFNNNLFTLREKYQYHWSARRYRVTGDKRFNQPIFSDYQKRLIRYSPKIYSLSKGKSPREIAEDMLKYYEPNTPKKKDRFEVYKKNPEVYFYINIYSRKKLSHFQIIE